MKINNRVQNIIPPQTKNEISVENQSTQNSEATEETDPPNRDLSGYTRGVAINLGATVDRTPQMTFGSEYSFMIQDYDSEGTSDMLLGRAGIEFASDFNGHTNLEHAELRVALASDYWDMNLPSIAYEFDDGLNMINIGGVIRGQKTASTLGAGVAFGQGNVGLHIDGMVSQLSQYIGGGGRTLYLEAKPTLSVLKNLDIAPGEDSYGAVFRLAARVDYDVSDSAALSFRGSTAIAAGELGDGLNPDSTLSVGVKYKLD